MIKPLFKVKLTLKIVMFYLALQLGKSLNTAREISTKNRRKNFMFSINNGKKQQYKKMLNDKLISALSDNFHMNSQFTTNQTDI